MPAHALQDELLPPSALPHGLIYRRDVVTADEESVLLARFVTLPFREARFREYFARRRVVRFHSPERAAAAESAVEDEVASHELPPFILELRRRVAAWAQAWMADGHGEPSPAHGVSPESFVHALVSEYRPGTPIGWHRDKPGYGIVVGLSLGSRATMRFRPLDDARTRTTRNAVALELEPRSVYVMRGPIRWAWQHSILPTPALRYSITFRTRAGSAAE